MAERIRKTEKVVIFGNRIVRKELRDTPRYLRHGKRKVRLELLKLYDQSIEGRDIEITPKMREIAVLYYNHYRKVGGSKSWNTFENDMLIVACAAFHALDIVVTEDNKTMRSKECMMAYKEVNKVKNLRQPNFIGMKEFEALLK